MAPDGDDEWGVLEDWVNWSDWRGWTGYRHGHWHEWSDDEGKGGYGGDHGGKGGYGGDHGGKGGHGGDHEGKGVHHGRDDHYGDDHGGKGGYGGDHGGKGGYGVHHGPNPQLGPSGSGYPSTGHIVYVMQEPPGPPIGFPAGLSPQEGAMWTQGFQTGYQQGLIDGKKHAWKPSDEGADVAEGDQAQKKKKNKSSKGAWAKFLKELEQQDPPGDDLPRWDFFDDYSQDFKPYPESMQRKLREKLQDNDDWHEAIAVQYTLGNEDVGHWTWSLHLFPLSALTEESEAKDTIDRLRKNCGKRAGVVDVPSVMWVQGWQENKHGNKRPIRMVLEATHPDAPPPPPPPPLADDPSRSNGARSAASASSTIEWLANTGQSTG